MTQHVGSGGIGGDGGGGGTKARRQRRGTFTNQRFDSVGSAAEWDQSLEGELIG